jgi:uncharacterized membrane protein YfcA
MAFKVLRGNGRFVLGMTTGSIACALILGIVPNRVLIPPLPCFLLISGIQLWPPSRRK